MATFGLIAEGVTDQRVIENILLGFFNCNEEDVNDIQPRADATSLHGRTWSNWELVLDHLASPDFEQAFGFFNYVVVHIDTDTCEEPNFGVPRREDGRVLEPRELIARVADKMREKIGEEVWARHGGQIIFAVAMDSTECWLLPLYAASRKDATHNCLHALNRALARGNKRPISPDKKEPRDYETLSRPFSKRRELQKHCSQNPSLSIFVENLEALAPEGPPPSDP